MTHREILLGQIRYAGNQVAQAIAGLDAEAAETRTNAESMTIREQIVHLGECGQALLTVYQGGEYDAWGSWQPADRSWEGTKRAWREARAQAVDRLTDDPKALEAAFNLLVAHDCYHVGQIVAARRVVHPEWDAYSVYSPPQTGEGF